uniref:hypothetical protein n=1 Tax=Mediterraneibacter faecis TaxID=592978 RepID=UPI004027E4A9
ASILHLFYEILLGSEQLQFLMEFLFYPDRKYMFMVESKNVPRHILAPAAVACDTYLVRRSAHP